MCSGCPEGVSVVVPVYNSASTLGVLLRRLTGVLDIHGLPYEILLVNDGSRDASWQRILELGAWYPQLRAIRLMRNYGQHNALLSGIRLARYSTIVTMDDDLQHPPEEIPTLLSQLTSDYDVIYGIPRTLPHSFERNILSRGTKTMLARAMGIASIRDISAFRAFRTELREAFAEFRSPSVLLDVLLSWGTGRFATVTVDHHPRRIGKSNYTPGKLFNQAMLIVTGYSTAPLRLASMVGFTFTFFGILVFFYVIGRYLFEGSLPGFPFLASIVALFSGAQLFALGLIGEYLARIFQRSMERPTYVATEIVEGAATSEPVYKVSG